MEKKFWVIDYPEEEKVKLATYLLEDHVEHWWQAMIRTKYLDHEGFVPWKEFFDVFRDKYFLEYIQDQKEQEFYDLVQGTMTVAEYEWKCSSLGKYVAHIFDDPCWKLKRFVGGLRSNIRCFMVMMAENEGCFLVIVVATGNAIDTSNLW